MFKACVLFIIGLVLLIKGGDWFVDGATGIAHKFRIPEVLIGATVVSIGTTIPEVMVSSSSAFQGISSIAYGNAIGSIICNTALVAAITLAVRPTPIDGKTIRTPLCFFFVSAIFYAVNAYVFGGFSRISGIILLLVFALYILLSVRDANKSQAESNEEIPEDDDKPLWKNLMLLIIGAALIAVGANLLVNNGTIIAEYLGVPETVIALTFVALGTSLPELVTAITALVKGHSDLSLGNVIGANLFNLVLVSGTAITIRPFELPGEKLIAGMNASLVVDVPLVFIVMLILTLPALFKNKLYRAQGISLLIIYFAYCFFQFFI